MTHSGRRHHPVAEQGAWVIDLFDGCGDVVLLDQRGEACVGLATGRAIEAEHLDLSHGQASVGVVAQTLNKKVPGRVGPRPARYTAKLLFLCITTPFALRTRLPALSSFAIHRLSMHGLDGGETQGEGGRPEQGGAGTPGMVMMIVVMRHVRRIPR